MLTHLDWYSLTAPGPYLMPTGLFCWPLSTAGLPFCVTLRQLPSVCSFFQLLWLAFPCPLLVVSRSRAQAFVWFRAKTNKKIVWWAHSLHSVTTEQNEFYIPFDCFQWQLFCWSHVSFPRGMSNRFRALKELSFNCWLIYVLGFFFLFLLTIQMTR